MIEKLIEPEIICTQYDRDRSEDYMERKMPEIMTRKNFNFEPVRWTCPGCGMDNNVSVHCYSKLPYQPIVTPRIYRCHNSRCQVRRFYYRDSKNQLWAQFIGKYDLIDELEFKSRFDPIKFYANLDAQSDYNQTTLF